MNLIKFDTFQSWRTGSIYINKKFLASCGSKYFISCEWRSYQTILLLKVRAFNQDTNFQIKWDENFEDTVFS